MLLPETRTYAARPPSDCGRKYCAQKRHTRTASAMPAALFVRSNAARSCAKRDRCGTTLSTALLLIVDRQSGYVRAGVGGRELRRVLERVLAAAGVRNAPTEVRAALDERVDVHRHGERDPDAARRSARCRGRRRARIGERLRL